MENNIYEISTAQISVNDNQTEKVVSIWKFLAMTVLYFIPIVGLIVCIVMSCIAKNKNVKNHARAMLIWLAMVMLIGGVSTAITVIKVVNVVTETVKQVEGLVDTIEIINGVVGTLNEKNEDGTQTEDMQDLTELLEGFGDGELEQIIGNIDSESLEDILNELQNGDVSGISEGDLTEMLEQLDTNDLENLINQLGIE